MHNLELLHPALPELIDAVKKSDTKAVRSLLTGHASVNASEADGSTALLLRKIGADQSQAAGDKQRRR